MNQRKSKNNIVRAIGVIDISSGGFSAMQQLVATPIKVHYACLTETANAPYEDKSSNELLDIAMKSIANVLKLGVEMIIVSSHTLSSALYPALDSIPEGMPPLINAVDAVAGLAARYARKKVAIMAPQNVIDMHMHKDVLLRLNPDLQIIEQPCSGLKEEIEEYPWNEESLHDKIKLYIENLLDVDTVILGSSAYFFVAPIIQALLPNAFIITTEKALIEQMPQSLSFIEDRNSKSCFLITSEKRPKLLEKLVKEFVKTDENKSPDSLINVISPDWYKSPEETL